MSSNKKIRQSEPIPVKIFNPTDLLRELEKESKRVWRKMMLGSVKRGNQAIRDEIKSGKRPGRSCWWMDEEKELKNIKMLVGKTITSACLRGIDSYDDTPYIDLEFTDGTNAIIVAGGGDYTGESEAEYQRIAFVRWGEWDERKDFDCPGC